MIKVLWYSDFLIHTGFGNVAEEILSRLHLTKKYDFTVLGINYFGEPYNTIESPYYHLRDIVVHPAEYNKDPLGSEKLINFLKKDRYDVLFVLQDVFNMSPLSDTLRTIRAEKGFKYIFYFPVDGPMEPEWVYRGVKIADYPVAYTNYGADEIYKHDPKLPLDIILHGVDTDVFYPLTDSERSTFRRQYFGAEPDEFVVTNVNRNQVRKDIPRTIVTWVQLKKRVPKSKLYLHMHIREQVGYDIPLLIKKLVPVNWRNDVICPNPASFGLHGFTKKTLRKIYGASDVVMSTTIGEGFGLSTVESAACRTPIVMPRHTALVEIVGANEERGYLADCSNFTILQNHDGYRVRPLVDVNSLADKIAHVYENSKEAKEKAEAAFVWVKENCNWDKIVAKWDKIFESAAKG